MKKLLSLSLIFIVCFSVIFCALACNEVPDEGETPQRTEGPSNTPTEEPSNQVPSKPEETPVAAYTTETVDGVEYIYYGEMVQTAASSDISNVLNNLILSENLTLNADGTVNYGDKIYYALQGDDKNAGRTLSNGLTIEKGKYYFFLKEKLRFRVLEKEGDNALLLADTIVAEYYFNASGSYNSLGYKSGTAYLANDYAASDLREYLNGSLFTALFTETERKSIVSTTVNNVPGESAYPLYFGTSTSSKDHVFVLSHREVKQYLEVEEDITVATELKDYQVALGYNGSKVGSYYYGAWWLRSNGNSATFGYAVPYTGFIGKRTECSVNLDYVCGIRPALWLKIK